MRILIIGANGQLGSDIVRVLKEGFPQHEAIPLTHRELEITDPASIRATLEMVLPDVVIDTAAYHKVDEVETNPEKAFAVNAIAPLNLAKGCNTIGARLVFLSTDYVFGGDLSRTTPYTEQDVPAPLNVYGASKLAGEYLVRANCEKHLVIRTSGLYGVRGASGKGGNFVELMLRLAREGKEIKVVNDQRLTPTFTPDLAAKLINLIDTSQFGVFHITSEGSCSWFEFASKIFELSQVQPSLKPTTSAEFKPTAIRPRYSVLAKQALAAAGLPPMRPWPEALAAYLVERTIKSSGA
jgi:dTDP-4-dehydrorhamnose reductase